MTLRRFVPVALATALLVSACAPSSPDPGGAGAPAPRPTASASGAFQPHGTGQHAPSEAPSADPSRIFGALPPEGTFPLHLPAPVTWPLPDRSQRCAGVEYPRDREAGYRQLVKYDHLVEAIVCDLFQWDTRTEPLADLEARGREWFVAEASQVMPHEYTSRWEELAEAGTVAYVQDFVDSTEWGAPSDTESNGYRSVVVTVRLRDASGAERVEQWVAFLTMTTVRAERTTKYAYTVATTMRLVLA